MTEFLDFLGFVSTFAKEHPLLTNLFWFVVLAGLLYFMKLTLLNVIDRKFDEAVDRRQWKVRARNIWLGSLVIVLLMIFGPELRTMALSLAAIAVAIVIAFKELIMCFLGSVLRSAAYFDIGDVIEIDGKRGEVIDADWVRFKLAEHDVATGLPSGRVLSFPNNVLFTMALFRDPLARQFVRETLSIEFKREDPIWSGVWESLPEILEGETKRVQELLTRYARRVRKLNDAEPIDAKSLVPRFELRPKGADGVEIIVRYLVNRDEKDRVRNALTQKAMSLKK